jgi:hypothetical protein
MSLLIYRNKCAARRPLCLGLMLALALACLPGCGGGPKEEPYRGTVSINRFPHKKDTDSRPGAK